jgi:hypothetical protein
MDLFISWSRSASVHNFEAFCAAQASAWSVLPPTRRGTGCFARVCGCGRWNKIEQYIAFFSKRADVAEVLFIYVVKYNYSFFSKKTYCVFKHGA